MNKHSSVTMILLGGGLLLSISAVHVGVYFLVLAFLVFYPMYDNYVVSGFVGTLGLGLVLLTFGILGFRACIRLGGGEGETADIPPLERSTIPLERVLAALAHSSILSWVLLNIVGGNIGGVGVIIRRVGGNIGIIGIGVALCIWLVMKGKSAYVRGQALQAVVYQVAVVVVWLVWVFAWGLLLAGILQIDLGSPPRWTGLPLIWIPLGFQVLADLYALWGAVRCLGGHDFRYAIVGKVIGRWI